jgi:hypothetical protein
VQSTDGGGQTTTQQSTQPTQPTDGLQTTNGGGQPAPQEKNLAALLERSRSMNTIPQNAPTGSKTEDEIMQLMEDEDEQKPEDIEPVIEETIPTTCSVMLPLGRLCKNRPRNNGKCTKHGG